MAKSTGADSVLYAVFNATGAYVRLARVKPDRIDEWITKMQVQTYVVKRISRKEPSIKTLERYSDDGICPSLDGCRVEPDGTCSHGYPSWLVALNYI